MTRNQALRTRLRVWVKMVESNAAHPVYTAELLTEAADRLDSIDRECSLCKPYLTLPDRVQALVQQ